MALDPSRPPGANFDLKNWKITLPIDPSGGLSGTAVEVKDLSSYTSKYFYTAPDGAMVFYTPVDGATTSGSQYARSELREMNGADKAAWKLSTGGSMVATLEVDAAAMRDGQGKKIIVGQIHGQDDELVRLYWHDSTLYFMNDQAGSGNSEQTFQLKAADGSTPNVSIDEKFSYAINAKGDSLDVKVYADGKVYSSVTKINDVWDSDQFYFKAGAYNNANEGNGSGFSQASFYDLRFSHAGVLSPDTAPAPSDPEPTDPTPTDPTPTDPTPTDPPPTAPPPVDRDVTAVHDSYTADAGKPLQVNAATGVLANDTGADGKLAKAGTYATMQGGSVTLKEDGSFTYTAKAGFSGNDGFSYLMRDADGDNDVAFVKLKVEADGAPSGPTDPGPTDPGPTDPAPSGLPVTSKTVTGSGSNNYVKGSSANDLMKGLTGRDVFWGGAGSDVMWGGADSDKDEFVFDTAIGTDVDWIMDFDAVKDGFRLENKIFSKLTKTGTLSSSFFTIGDAAKDANDFIVYDQSSGALSYDADGSGAGKAVQFAQIDNKAALTASDFLVI